MTGAGALGEARTRSGMRARKRGAEAAAVMAEIAEELQLVAEGRAGPAIRCAALEALFWFEVRSLAAEPSGHLVLTGHTSAESWRSCR